MNSEQQAYYLNRRDVDRIEQCLLGTLHIGCLTFPVTIANFSATGIKVQGLSLKKGLEVSVRWDVPGLTDRLKGSVMWSVWDGSGIQLDQPLNRDHPLLHSWFTHTL